MLDQIKNFSQYDVNCASYVLWIVCLQMILLMKIENLNVDQFLHRCGIEVWTKPVSDQIVLNQTLYFTKLQQVRDRATGVEPIWFNLGFVKSHSKMYSIM